MPAGWKKIGRAAGWGVGLGLTAALAVEGGSIFLGRNWHTIIPGQAYRSAQLSYDQLVESVRGSGVKTVVNLRGTCPDLDWYVAESRATRDADIGQEDITLSANRLPAPDELRRLVGVLDHAAYPLLLHCRQGVDRTGLAAALLLLLRTDATPAEARRQLSLRYGHIPIGPTWCMREFLDLYDAWLARHGRPHSPAALREWADHDYCPAQFRGHLELLDAAPRIPVGVPAVIRVRAVNTSIAPWHFHPGTETGIHVRFLVYGPDWKLAFLGRAGQFETVVAPAGTLDLALAVPPAPAAGTYHVVADLADGNQYAFSQFGNHPLEVTVIVGDPAPSPCPAMAPSRPAVSSPARLVATRPVAGGRQRRHSGRAGDQDRLGPGRGGRPGDAVGWGGGGESPFSSRPKWSVPSGGNGWPGRSGLAARCGNTSGPTSSACFSICCCPRPSAGTPSGRFT